MKRWDPWQMQKAPTSTGMQLLFHNNRYHVFVRRYRSTNPDCPYPIIHLSIRDENRSARHDWREMQRIKNEIVGPEIEMVELYPRESQKVDGSNQFHFMGAGDDRTCVHQHGTRFQSRQNSVERRQSETRH
jgi:hypothetical protein